MYLVYFCKVSTYGAAVSYIYASDTAFGNYGNGVFSKCTSEETNHAILVVGYGTEGGVNYWLVKNSWGSGWGKNGLIKIRRGTSECGIGSYCYAAQCEKTTGKLSDPPVTPPPVTVPPKQQCDISKSHPNLNGSFTLRWGGESSADKLFYTAIPLPPFSYHFKKYRCSP